jgi:hypothetical protein
MKHVTAIMAILLSTLGAMAQDVNSPFAETPGHWVLVYRVGAIQKHKTFPHKSAADNWVDHQPSTYVAVELKHGGILYPCQTYYTNTYEYGKLVHYKEVRCYSKAEEEENERRNPPQTAFGWTVN